MGCVQDVEYAFAQVAWDDESVVVEEQAVALKHTIPGLPVGPAHYRIVGAAPLESQYHVGVLRHVALAIATSLADMAMEVDADAISANSLSLVGFPVGRLDAASAKAFDLPGRWMIWNFQSPVRCLSRKRRGLATNLRGLEPRSETSGLWSVATIRQLYPCVK